MKNARYFPGTDVNSDHNLVAMKVESRMEAMEMWIWRKIEKIK